MVVAATYDSTQVAFSDSSLIYQKYDMTTQISLLLSIGILFMTSCAANNTLNPTANHHEDEKLKLYYLEYLEVFFSRHPTQATAMGDHRYDHLMDDVSEPARANWKHYLQKTIDELPNKIRYDQLSRSSQIDYDIFRDDVVRSVWIDEHEHPFENDPRIYPTKISSSIYDLFMLSTVPKSVNVRNAIARMRLAPALLAQGQINLKHPPRVVVETARQQTIGAISFFERELFELIGETKEQEELKRAANQVVVALKQYLDFIDQQLLQRSNDAWRLGKERFAKKLELVLEANQSADQVMADAQAEFTRVRQAMTDIAQQLWPRYFPDRRMPNDDATGRQQIVALILQEINRDHGTADELVHHAKATITGLKSFIAKQHIIRIPEPDKLLVIEMPEFRRGNSVADLTCPPPLDSATHSIYAISPPPKHWTADQTESFLQEYNRSMLQILSIHEAYPGHHVQLTLANQHPSLIRKILSSGVYAEGWAVYCEQMMLDQGYGNGDLALRLIQYKFYLRAVANAILDYRMHCTHMSDEEAVNLLVTQAFQARGEAALKVTRAKQTSCQLSTYFVGRMAFVRLRQAVEQQLGQHFNLEQYHHAVVDQGSVPVKYLPELVGHALKLK
jgi:uncharacterized protein (DUF885 family)